MTTPKPAKSKHWLIVRAETTPLDNSIFNPPSTRLTNYFLGALGEMLNSPLIRPTVARIRELHTAHETAQQILAARELALAQPGTRNSEPGTLRAA